MGARNLARERALSDKQPGVVRLNLEHVVRCDRFSWLASLSLVLQLTRSSGVAKIGVMRLPVDRRFAIAVVVVLGVAASGHLAHAVMEGRVVKWADYPWVASVGDDECAGVLVAPNRLLTNATCADFVEGDQIRIGNVRRRATGVALHPSLAAELARGPRVGCDEVWEQTECTPDLALVRLSRAVRHVQPPALSQVSLGNQAILVGHGTRSLDDEGAAVLRAARLRVISDTQCQQRYRRLGEDFLVNLPAPDTVCARDPHPPRNAGICTGDGGAPLVARRNGRWKLLGIGSLAQACGEGDWPSVFAEVWPHRAFIQQSRPKWRPIEQGYAVLTGIGRVGRTLTCRAPRFKGQVDQLLYWFSDEHSPPRTFQRSPKSTYVVQDSDRGDSIACWVLAINAGGVARAVTDGERVDIE